MARPKRYPDGRIGTHVRMTEDLHERLAAAAAEREVSVNWMITKACEDFLAHLIPVDEIMWTRRPVTMTPSGPPFTVQPFTPGPWRATGHAAHSGRDAEPSTVSDAFRRERLQVWDPSEVPTTDEPQVRP
jgi:hypothetical protein